MTGERGEQRQPEATIGYILRITREELERQLYTKRSFYVGIRRNWSDCTKVLFVRKAALAPHSNSNNNNDHDVFICSAVIEKIVIIDQDKLSEDERKLCLENNWYGKILFSKLTRFLPPVPAQETPFANQNPLTLHGATVAAEKISKTEQLARVRIII